MGTSQRAATAISPTPHIIAKIAIAYSNGDYGDGPTTFPP